jgi:hypothetical protein
MRAIDLSLLVIPFPFEFRWHRGELRNEAAERVENLFLHCMAAHLF